MSWAVPEPAELEVPTPIFWFISTRFSTRLEWSEDVLDQCHELGVVGGR